ncbi:MAG: alcohol dehydrogenase catalytic domain-containing protein [Deltaproteobacteria bacterium]|nr:alcohol dehydrogenase catalytic domain-containing protein [Deltaproteobacteria bacterium]
MKALVYRGPGQIRVEEVPPPELRDPEDAIVRVTTTAICGSDLHVLHGIMPKMAPGTTVGHEFTGIVESVGDRVEGIRPGDRVLGPAAVWCGHCVACRNGLPSACLESATFGCGPLFGDLPGAQAEFVRVPFAGTTLQRIPESLSEEQALFAGDILLTAYTAVEGITPGGPGVRAGDTVAIFGAGPVGLCAVAAARLFGPARIVAVDLEDYRLEAATRLGAQCVVNAARTDPVKTLRELTAGWGANFVIEAVGRPETLLTALRAVGAGGTVSVVGVFDKPVEIPVPRLLNRSVSLKLGLGHLGHMEKLLRLIEAGSLDLTSLITHRLPLSEGPRGYEIFEKKLDGALKVLLKPGD